MRRNFFRFFALSCLCLISTFHFVACKDNPANDSSEASTPTTEANVLSYQKITGEEEYRVLGLGSIHSADIVIPETHNDLPVTEIGENAFENGIHIKSITIPNSVKSIGKSAFWGCVGLTNVTLPDSITEIGDWAFYNCSNLTTVTLSNNLSSIGNWAFNESGLTDVTIPDHVTFIGNLAFKNCQRLKNITVSENNTHYKSIDGHLYNEDGTTLIQYSIGNPETTFTIPNMVTSLADFSFYGSENLTNLFIPNNVLSIGGYTFGNCNNLTNVTFNDDVNKWNSVEKKSHWNDGVPAEYIICSNGTIEL